MAATRGDQLDRVIAILDELADPADRDVLAELQARLDERRLRVLVAGEAKRGKSTLLNALLRRDVLPTGVTPVTALATTIRRAEANESLTVTFTDDRTERHPLPALADFVTERGNPANARGVRRAEVSLESALLAHFPVELVDTPGTGSVHAHNTEAAEASLETLDAAIVVLSADPPISSAERELLARVGALSVHTFVVLNKADRLTADELAEAQAFTAEVCGSVLGREATIFACSARDGRDDPGFAQFAATFESYLGDRARDDSTIAVRGHLQRMGAAMLDAARLTRRSVELAASDSADRVLLFRQAIERVAQRGAEVGERCEAAERRLRRALDHAATERVGSLTDECRAAVGAALDGPLAELPAAEIDAEGRDLAVRVIRDAAESWRRDQAMVLDRGLATLSEQAVADLEAALSALRDAAAELLGVTLSAQPVAHSLQPSERFWYAFERGIATELPFAGLARDHLPGRVGRARRRVLDEIPELADRQLGRARADLADRLRTSLRRLAGTVRAEHDAAVTRMRAALDAAQAVAGQTADARARHDADLSRRIALLEQAAGVEEQPNSR